MNGDSDFMELGDTNLVPIKDGWLLDKSSGNKIDPYGRVFDSNGEIILDPKDFKESARLYTKEDYDWDKQ